MVAHMTGRVDKELQMVQLSATGCG